METLLIPEWLKDGKYPAGGSCQIRGGFLEKNLTAIASFMRDIIIPQRCALKRGFFQGISPKARIAGIMVLIAGAAAADNIFALFGLIFLTIAISLFSSVELRVFFKRAAGPFVFTFFAVIPVFFDFFMPGEAFVSFSVFGWKAAITYEGLSQAGRLLARVASIGALIFLLQTTTKESDIFRGLRELRVPRFFAASLFMTFRYILVLLKIVEDTSLSRKSRTINPSLLKDSRKWFAAKIGFILERALKSSEDVTMAMIARGFEGDFKTLNAEPFKGRDYLWLAFTFFVFFLMLGI